MQVVNSNQPSPSVLEAFKLSPSTRCINLDGGQGKTYLADNIIFKPTSNIEESIWIAEVYASIGQIGFRIPSPIATTSDEWTFEQWTAWEFLEGNTLKGEKYKERLAASQAFHKALANYSRPSLLNNRNDAWSQADRIVWENKSWQPHSKIQSLYNKLESYQEPLDISEQIMHGDIAGNMLYQTGQAITIIDFSPYWRPAAYSEALLCVDSIMWEQAPWSILDLVNLDITFRQLMLRAVMRRLVEVDRHFHLNSLPESSLEQVNHFENFSSQLISNVLT